MKVDDFLDDNDEQDNDDSDGPRGTHISLNEKDHPKAYELASKGGAIRKPFSGRGGRNIEDFMATVIREALGPMFEDGDKLPAIEFIDPSEEEVREFIRSNPDMFDSDNDEPAETEE